MARQRKLALVPAVPDTFNMAAAAGKRSQGLAKVIKALIRVTRAGFLYLGHLLGAPRKPRQLKT